jgi:chromosome segregation protein
MLSALELVGFKSFADKTRFEFPDGITVVVGPNGSGKSNIVDAIKWVLGSQSAKSLRGSDMADVIFKGSAAGGRKAANSAEATLVFDNTKKILDVESTEVSVTRRVYRSGESEYLINRQPCRLKDVKDLFRGTGVGVDAYSLIEQGKVDRMLQASPMDRRAIFEEAAGISRFKAKKVEAQKRLARVEQGLLRLSDIVDEVGSRLNGLKNQAAKAQRYREMTVRLKMLRTQIGWADQADSRTRIKSLKRLLEQTKSGLSELTETLTRSTKNVQQCETVLNEQQQEQSQRHQQLQALQRRHAKHESDISADTQRLSDLASEKELLRSRQDALIQRADMSSDEVKKCRSEVAELETLYDAQRAKLHRLQADYSAIEEQCGQQASKEQRLRDTESTLQRELTEMLGRVAAAESQSEQVEDSIARIGREISQLRIHQSNLTSELERRRSIDADLVQEAESTARELVAAKESLEDTQGVLEDRQSNIVSLSAKLEGTRERLSVLAQLESRREGVAHGAQQLIDLSKSNPTEPWTSIVGMVADLIEIDLHLAPLIDVALGPSAETVVLGNGQLIQMLRDGELPVDGRVSMIRLDRLSSRQPGEKVQLDGLHGVLGRADRMVHCDPPYAGLIRHLLGTTWLVDTLDTALDLSHLRGAGLRFVTATCERIESDGTVMLGTLQSALGLVSRRSELQAARDEISHLESLSRQSVQEIANLQDNISELRAKVRDYDEAARQASANQSRHALETESLRQRLQQNQELGNGLLEQRDATKTKRVELSEFVKTMSESISTSQTGLGSLVEQIREVQSDFETLRERRKSARDSMTDQRVALAKIEQRLEGDRAALQQLSRDHDERHEAVRDAQSSAERNTERRLETEARLADLEQALVAMVDEQDVLERTAAEAADRLSQTQLDRDAARENLTELQRQLEKQQLTIEQTERDLQLANESLEQLVRRFAEDYTIDLTDVESLEDVEHLEDRAAAEQEISELRGSIASVGAVNMEALAELDQLQERYDTMHGHYTDLVDSKASLERVIEKINADSRELFMETLDAVRANFQELYRKSFGGGSADIILEAGEDVLECGIEIVATPPGKTSLSNSLLSGGEKALTAVALIMAIFQFRPSPFCILDEVDAPFDEANIGRFVSVLREFLDWTKFVVVTHSKKTMTAANTLYGVTMQESGVSKKVAVRFEDVDEDGAIRKAA